MPEYVNEDWRDKLEAQQRHEHLAATVRIAIGELLYVAEKADELDTAEKLYGVVEILGAQLKAGDVAYEGEEVASAT